MVEKIIPPHRQLYLQPFDVNDNTDGGVKRVDIPFPVFGGGMTEGEETYPKGFLYQSKIPDTKQGLIKTIHFRHALRGH